MLEPHTDAAWVGWGFWFAAHAAVGGVALLARRQLDDARRGASRAWRAAALLCLSGGAAIVVCGWLLFVVGGSGALGVALLLAIDSATIALGSLHGLARAALRLCASRTGGGRASWDGREGGGVALLDFACEATALVLQLAHHGHIWSLSGITFSLVDFFLLMSGRAVCAALVTQWTLLRDARALDALVDSTFVDAAPRELIDEASGAPRECSICLEAMTAAKRLPLCGHLFHRACLRRWLLDANDSCPLCRGGINEAAVARLARERAAVCT